MDASEAMIDCHVCGLPMETQAELEVEGEPWLGMLCLGGHFITLRQGELPGASTR